MNVAIVGLGSRSGGDDAVGLEVVEALRAEGDLDAALLAIQDAAALIDLLVAYEAVILVDAVVDAGAPGTVLTLSEASLDGGAQPVSTHALSVPAALSLARILHGATARLDLVGIAIALGLCIGLSPAVVAAVPEAATAVRALLAALQQNEIVVKQHKAAPSHA